MALTRCLVFVALFAGVAAVEVKPIEKVISLIEGLKQEVSDEGAAEASSYDKFACFCKDQSNKKSKSVNKGNDNINVLSADIGEKTQNKKDDATELTKRTGDQEKLSRDLDETHVRCAQEESVYEAEAADLSKAISSLRSAIKAMEDAKGAASLIAIKSVVKTLPAAAMAKASALTKKAVVSMLQQKVDPDDPAYGNHSGDIIALCTQLLGEFKDSKSTLDSEWGKTDKGCKETKASLNKEMDTNKQAMDDLGKEIEKLGKEIAEHREDLVQAEGDLKDDELYLKDLTTRCQDRANDYDQRSQMRGQELGALTSALDALTNKVSGADEVNERALLQVPKAVTPAADSKKAAAAPKLLSFLQGSLVKAHSQGFLAADESLALEAKKNQALTMLRAEGRRIGSVTIASLAARVAADPFKKVKGLIQKLIERLLAESQAEATKKGFCDTELAKAEHDRDRRFREANDLSRETANLEAKEDELSEEIEVLTKDIKDEEASLKETTEEREAEKQENADALKTAKGGLAGITEAITILKSFYSSAAKAAFIQASPLDEDTAGAGFKGNYKGAQGGMKAVFALLETIQSDFDRTIRKTEESEAQSHREFVEFSQTTKSVIAGKSTKKELDTQDLETTRTNIKKNMADLQATTDLLDDALEELKALKPQCIDTGMSYKERVAKREEEIAALTKALEILAP